MMTSAKSSKNEKKSSRRLAAQRETDGAFPIGEKLLTLREAAEVLRLCPRTVREYVQRGEIEGRIIGGRWRFRRADLDAFFENAPRNWDFAENHDHRK
jgi:excisionase family DNA binding protein